MKNGMKQTEIGEIPVEWEIGRMEDYCEVIDPHPSHRAPQEDPKGFPFIGIGDIDEHGRINFAKARKISLEDVLQQQQVFELQEGDMGFGRVASIGKIVWFKKQTYPYAISPTMALIRPKNVLPNFAYHFLASELTSSQFRMVSAGSTRISIGMKNLRLMHFVVPPLPEQQKIAEILSTLDEKTAVMDEQLVQTQEMKKGLVQRLLTKGIGHTQFKDSLLGEIPASWEAHSLNDLISVKHGFAFNGELFTQVKNEKLLLTPGNFHPEGGVKFVWRKQKYYDGNVPDEYVLSAGDLIVAMTDLTQDCNILGAPAIIPKENFKFLHNQRLGLVQIKNPDYLYKEFIYHLFNFPAYRNHMRSTKTGTTVSHTSPKTIYAFELNLPPLREQRQIADILTTVDEKIGVLQDKKAQVQALKRGLMQQLLTGRRRVRVASTTEVAELV